MKSKFTWIFTLLLAFFVQFSFAQEKTVTGTVSDVSGPLPSVNVVVKGTSRSTQTDLNGQFRIQAAQGEVLEFTFMGLKTQAVTVGVSSTVNVTMAEDATVLENVVINTGYNSLSKDKTVAAVSVVDRRAIDQVPIATFDQMLQGTTPGLQVAATTGQPGASGTVRLRGVTSINGNNNPLYVVDGVPIASDNFRSLNPNDFETVSVLKDAAASSLYGSRGAAGVIVITTKSAKRNSGLNVQYRSLFGITDRPTTNFDVMNASQYLNFQKYQLGDGRGSQLSDAEIAAISAQTNTDWSEIFFKQGRTISQEVNFAVGKEDTRSYTSLGYFEQEGITRRSALQRFTFRTNFDANPNERFHYGYRVTLNTSKSDFVVDKTRDANTGGDLDNPFIVPYIGQPWMSPYNPDGSLNIVGTVASGAYNPNGTINISQANGFNNTPYLALNTQSLNTDVEREIRGVGQINADYMVFDNLKAGGSFGVDYQYFERLYIDHPESLRGLINPTQTSVYKGSRYENFFRDAAFNMNAYLNYSNTFAEKHDVDVSLYTEYYYKSRKESGYQAYGINPIGLADSGSGLVDPTIAEGAARPYIPSVFGTHIERAILSYFGVGNYTFDRKYGVQASVRRDGSSRFLKENRWGTFWAVAGTWNVHNEAFLNDTFVDQLKLRVSYGSVGNEALPGFYAGYETISAGTGYNGSVGYYPTVVDPRLKWETTTTANAGIDFGLFGRLNGSIDVYEKRTSDLFLARNISALNGQTSVNSNAGEMTNKGVELALNYDLVSNTDLKVNLFFNGAYNKNEILSVGNDADPTARVGGQQVGNMFGEYFMVKWAGVSPADGRPLYYDINGNLTDFYSADDRVSTGKSYVPKYTGGFGTSVTYKGFNLYAQFTFAAEQYRWNQSYSILEDPNQGAISNLSTSMLTAWQNPGDITSVPSLDYSVRLQTHDKYLEDASFLRLRNVALSYTLNGKDNNINFFNSVRFSLSAVNMFTWSKWRGFDPESDDSSNFFDYPSPRQYTFGVDINL